MFHSLPNMNATLVFQSEAYLHIYRTKIFNFYQDWKIGIFIFHLLLPFLLPVKPVITVLLPVEPVMERSTYRMRGQ